MNELPECKHRGELLGSRYICKSPLLLAPNGVTIETCMMCPFVDTKEKKFSSTKNAETDWNQSTRCRHLGDVIETRVCNMCGDMKGHPYEIRECKIHGICSERKRDSRVECCLGCFEYEPAPEVTPSPAMPYHSPRKIQSWGVGITTAPRTQHRTLPECVESVIANGWNPVIYAEPNTDLSGLPKGLQIVKNTERLGVWRNWKAAAGDLLKRFPDAEFILTIQDDTIFHPQSRWFAEHFFPVNSQRVFSFYTPKHYGQRADVFDQTGKIRQKNLPYETARKWITKTRARRGWKLKSYHKDVGMHKINTRSLWGACAMAFPRKLLQAVLEHKTARNWLGHRGKMNPEKWRERQTSEPWRIQNSDTAIGNILNALGWEYWCPVPSLADHIAEASADGVGHGGRGGRRSAAWFAAGDLRETFASESTAFGDQERYAKFLKTGQL